MMLIIHVIWSQDKKYTKRYGIKRCRRKANSMSSNCNQGIYNEAGSDSTTKRDKNIVDE